MSHKRQIIDLIVDPSTDDYSASRLSLIILTLDLVFLSIVDALGWKVETAEAVAKAVGFVCGVYLVSTGVRVWRNRVIDHDKDGNK